MQIFLFFLLTLKNRVAPFLCCCEGKPRDAHESNWAMVEAPPPRCTRRARWRWSLLSPIARRSPTNGHPRSVSSETLALDFDSFSFPILILDCLYFVPRARGYDPLFREESCSTKSSLEGTFSSLIAEACFPSYLFRDLLLVCFSLAGRFCSFSHWLCCFLDVLRFLPSSVSMGSGIRLFALCFQFEKWGIRLKKKIRLT